jgi:hypothetical protein
MTPDRVVFRMQPESMGFAPEEVTLILCRARSLRGRRYRVCETTTA